jgi:unsaturated rhamnogalacturonyl hydrolase
MTRLTITFLLLLVTAGAPAQTFTTEQIMSDAEKVAGYFISNYPDVGADSYVGGKRRNSKIWTRGVFYEGLLNIYREQPREEWLKYTLDWGEYHNWISSSDSEARNANADYQCCGQAYLQLYRMNPAETVRMEHIKMRIDQMMETGKVNYWYWIDAIQMSMPVMAMLGDITGDESYWDYMYRSYQYTRNSHGGSKKGAAAEHNDGTVVPRLSV